MVRRYKDLCKEYRCSAKVFTQMRTGLRDLIGHPDLLVLFTSTMSHKMLRSALVDAKEDTVVVRSHTSSMEALRGILDAHTARS